MRRLLRRSLALIALLALAAPATAQEATTVTVDSTQIVGTNMVVRGTVALGGDALAALTVATDSSGDASPGRAGLDLGDTTMRVVMGSSPKLVVEQKLHDGVAALNGNAPATGFSWPIIVNGEDTSSWLGAGSAGSNFMPRTGSWTALCTVTSGWNCGTTIPGGISTAGITWELPFKTISPAIEPGSTIDVGSVYGGVPASFAWPSVFILAGLAPADRATVNTGYLVPGGVDLAIAPTGTPDTALEYVAQSKMNTRTGAFSAVVPLPSDATGAYTLHARSCFGDAFDPTCVTTSYDFTV